MTRNEDSSDETICDSQDRGMPPVNRVRTLQARVSAVLALGVAVLLGGGLLGWYYWGHLPSDAPTPTPARKPAPDTETTLPPLGRPRTSPAPQRDPEPNESAERSALEAVLGPAPPEPLLEPVERSIDQPPEITCDSEWTEATSPAPRGAAQRAQTPRDRSAPAFISFVDRTQSDRLGPPTNEGVESEGAQGAQLSRSLVSTTVPTVRAQRLPDLQFLLPKGATIDCTLETAIDTALPSLVTCISATDTYSADGSVVLIDRGAKLFGETRPAQTDAGARVFVVWQEVRSGDVVARLDSPATDAQGRGGLAGYVDRHFWARFGAAFLVSLIDGGIDAATASRDRQASIVVNPDDSNALLTEVLRSTADIVPTKGVLPGSRIKVLIARDVDFASVYELTHVAH